MLIVAAGISLCAARNEIVGREGVARYLAGMARKSLTVEVTIGEVNGSLALVLHSRGQLFGVAQLETDGEMIYAVHLVLNPDKLGHVAARASVATS